MPKLLACPFCRELSTEGERTHCEACDVALVPMHQLPPSLEALAEEAARGEQTPPEYRRLPWTYTGRGRGLLPALALAGLVCFFSPWVELYSPSSGILSGFDMARGQAGWLWGGAVGWFLTLPLVVSRRSVVELRGIRVICATFALMTLAETGMLLTIPPAQSPHVRADFSYAWGLYASLAVSVVATWVAARLGGRVDDLRDLSHAITVSETSAGQQVH